MFEIVMLTENNISEIAKRMNRPEVDLVDEYITAREAGETVFITLPSTQAWEFTTDDSFDYLLRAADISLGEFKEIIIGDIQYVITQRLDWMRGLLDPADVLPPATGGTRKELMDLVNSDRANDSFRSTFLRNPMQWARKRDPGRKKLSEAPTTWSREVQEQQREIRRIRGW